MQIPPVNDPSNDSTAVPGNSLKKGPWPKFRLTFWQMVPVALGLHAGVLMFPLPDAQKQHLKPVAVRITALPPKVLTPKPVPVVPKPTTVPKPVLMRPVAPSLPIASPQPVSSPTPTPSPSSTPSPSPTPIASPSPAKSFQLEGAKGCPGTQDCYAVTETDGRLIYAQLEQRLQTQGYELTQLDLEDETGMGVYQVSKAGQVQHYLHILWTDQGTTYLQAPKQLSRAELQVVAQGQPLDGQNPGS